MSNPSFSPDYAVPPGATLLETIQHLGLTQKELALRMGRPLKTINEIIKGVASITAETALQLEKVTGIPASFWNHAEANYRERLARIQDQEQIAAQSEWVRSFSYSKMVDLNLVSNTRDPIERVQNLLSYFGVASNIQWERTYSDLRGAARESGKTESELGDLSAWLRAGELLSQRKECQPYDAKAFRAALDTIRGLTCNDAAKVWGRVADLCADAGVAVVLVPELPKTHVYGFTRWLTPEKAIIQLSLRYKTEDILWFTFFHEAAHILLHGKKDVFMEFRGVANDKETEANHWAADFLIPSQRWEKWTSQLSGPPTKVQVSAFAKELGIGECIIVGRLQREKMIPYSSPLGSLKARLEIVWKGIL